MIDKVITEAIIQYGFLGFCAILVCILIWRMKIDDQYKNTLIDVVQKNNTAFEKLMSTIDRLEVSIEYTIESANKTSNNIQTIKEKIIECTSRKG